MPFEGRYHNARSLKKLAYDASFSLLFNKLVLLSTNTSSHQGEIQNLVQDVRDYYDEQLVECLKHSIREKCIEKLNDKVEYGHDDATSKLDYCVILDGIIDTSYKGLDIFIPQPSRSGFRKLMSVIAHRCPQLERLKIFGEEESSIPSNMVLSKTSAISHSQNALNHLTLLRFKTEFLTNISNHFLECLVTTVGATCPNLTDLWLGDLENVGNNKKLILSLLIKKEWLDALFPGGGDEGYCEDSVLEKLRIPTEFLNPLCFKLQKLKVPKPNPFGYSDFSGSEYAFALRHLPQLMALMWYRNGRAYDADFKIPVHLIKTLFKVDQEREFFSHIQTAFEEKCRSLKPYSSKLFSGPLLSVIRVSNVLIRDLNALRAVGLMCPQLESVTFQGVNYVDSPSLDQAVLLESILREFRSNTKKLKKAGAEEGSSFDSSIRVSWK